MPVRVRNDMHMKWKVGPPIRQLILLKKQVFIRIQELYCGLFNHLEPPPPNSDEESSTAILVGRTRSERLSACEGDGMGS